MVSFCTAGVLLINDMMFVEDASPDTVQRRQRRHGLPLPELLQ